MWHRAAWIGIALEGALRCRRWMKRAQISQTAAAPVATSACTLHGWPFVHSSSGTAAAAAVVQAAGSRLASHVAAAASTHCPSLPVLLHEHRATHWNRMCHARPTAALTTG